MLRQKHKITISLAVFIAIAACALCFRYQRGDASPTPTTREASKGRATDPDPSATPNRTAAEWKEQHVSNDAFKVDVENLLELAKDGDAAAAEVAFRETSQCKHASTMLRITIAQINVCAEETRSEFLDKCRNSANELKETFEAAKEQSKPCSELSPYDELNLRYQATRIAAKFGNADAQMCVVEGNYDQQIMRLPDEEREQYQVDAIDYFNQAMERGDWRAVEAMTLSRRSLGHVRGLEYLLTDGDDHMVYRMNRLLQYGAVGTYVDEFRTLALHFPGSDTDAYADDDLWAKQEYEAHFSTSPRLEKNPTVCGQPF